MAKWCLEERVSIVDTMRTNRKGIPKEMKELGNREEKSTKFCYSVDNKMLLTSYVDQKNLWKGKCYSTLNNVINVISTMHKDVRETSDQRGKPL